MRVVYVCTSGYYMVSNVKPIRTITKKVGNDDAKAKLQTKIMIQLVFPPVHRNRDFIG